MKLLKLLPLAVAALSQHAFADDPSYGTLVLVHPTDVFAPVGFDDNDEAEVVVDGYLPDTCYRLAKTEVETVPSENRIIVRQWARRFPGVCLQVILPYTVEARIGQLPAGDFAIEAGGVTVERLAIKPASNPGPDDHLYAPVDTARIETLPSGTWVTLEGRFTNTCMTWDEIQVINSGKTIEVLPIVAMRDGSDCTATETPFSRRVQLPQTLTEGRHVVHVRSLNGKAVNVAFSVTTER